MTRRCVQTASGEAESSVRQDVSANDQVAVVLLARHRPGLPQHVRPRLRALPPARLARHLPRHVRLAALTVNSNVNTSTPEATGGTGVFEGRWQSPEKNFLLIVCSNVQFLT